MSEKLSNQTTAILLAAAAFSGYVFVKAIAKTALKQSATPTQATLVSHSLKVASTKVTSHDGKTQITLAPGWSNIRTASTPSKFSIKAANASRGMHLVVSTQPKAQGIDMAELAEITARGVGQQFMQNPKVERTKLKQVNNYAAVQYKVQGTVTQGSVKQEVMLLLTIAETPQHFHIITMGGPATIYSQYRAECDRIIQSFKEVKTTASI